MTIACLGWGSLLWDPRELPLTGTWQTDGPPLPLEFARASEDGRLTLVVVEHPSPVPTLCAPLKSASLAEADEALAQREGLPRLASIGRSGAHYPFAERIAEWASARGLSGVVWTALKPGVVGRRGAAPNLDDLKAYLASLPPDRCLRAAEYIAKAPKADCDTFPTGP